MELGGDVEGMIGQLDDLDQALVRRGAAADQALILKRAGEDAQALAGSLRRAKGSAGGTADGKSTA